MENNQVILEDMPALEAAATEMEVVMEECGDGDTVGAEMSEAGDTATDVEINFTQAVGPGSNGHNSKKAAKLERVRKTVILKLEKYKNGNPVLGSMKRNRREVDVFKEKKQREAEVGICEYVGNIEGFYGIVKHRYSDFIVNEIDENGCVVHLTDLSIPSDDELAKIEEHRVAEGGKPDCISEEDWRGILYISSTDNTCNTVEIMVDDLDKEIRKNIHMTVKCMFKSLETNTMEKDGHKYLIIRRKKTKLAKKQPWANRSGAWPRDRPPYTHFVLFKEHWDTFTIINTLSDRLNIPPSKFHVAGTKDRRGRTTQRACVKKVTIEKLVKASSKLDRLWLGNFEFKENKVKLGLLQGNHFKIVLRNVVGSQETVDKALTSLKENGFLNYFGQQRFGMTVMPSHRIGLAMLLKQWKKAVEYLLAPRPAETPTMQKMRHIYSTEKNAKEAYEALSYKEKRVTVEGRVLSSLSEKPNNFHDALEKVAHNQRMMYTHAHQSYVWNTLVSRRIATFGTSPIIGDLYLPEDWNDVDNLVDDPEMDSDDESGRPKLNFKTSSSTNSKSSDNAQPPLIIDGHVWKDREKPSVVTEENISTVTMDRIVMPVPGWDVIYPENEVGQWYKELMEKREGDTSLSWISRNKFSGLCGGYRRVLVRPENLEWSIWKYSDPTQPLIQADLDVLKEFPPPMEDPDGEFRALVMEFSLPAACYATMALREVTRMDTSVMAQMLLEHEPPYKKLKSDTE